VLGVGVEYRRLGPTSSATVLSTGDPGALGTTLDVNGEAIRSPKGARPSDGVRRSEWR
jgi:hypothetical protein